MDKEPSAALQQRPGMVDSASRLQKTIPLVRNTHRHNILTANPFLYHVRKMMDIYDRAFHTVRFEFACNMFYQRLPTHRHKGLGHRIGDRLQAGT